MGSCLSAHRPGSPFGVLSLSNVAIFKRLLQEAVSKCVLLKQITYNARIFCEDVKDLFSSYLVNANLVEIFYFIEHADNDFNALI